MSNFHVFTYGSLKQGFTLRPSGQLVSPFFEFGGLIGHSFFKGAGLFHSTALRHSGLLE